MVGGHISSIIHRNPTSPVGEDHLSKLAVKSRRVTPEDIQSFQIPDNLHGKQFMFSPDACTDDSASYEVIGYYVARDKSVQYDVVFDDCDDYIRVDAVEMMRMLEDSLYLSAG